jgi:hypothetical protein
MQNLGRYLVVTVGSFALGMDMVQVCSMANCRVNLRDLALILGLPDT